MKWFGRGEGDARRRRRHGRRRPSDGVTARGRSRRAPARRRAPRRRPAPPERSFRLHWRRVLLGVGAVLLAAGTFQLGRVGAQWLSARPELAVRELRVEGATWADSAEFGELAGIHAGDSWLSLDTAGIRFRLESHPWVKSARVRRPWPGRVLVRIAECEPVAIIRVDERPYGLCEDLRIVPLHGDTEELPVVRDFASGRGADPETLARAVEYVLTFRRHGLDGGLHLDLRQAGGDVIALPERGFSARIEGGMAAGKAARSVAAFLERLDGEGGERGTLQIISEGTAVWRASA